MSVYRSVFGLVLAVSLFASAPAIYAHGSGNSELADGFIVTRHFTGLWDQVDQEAQGIALQVIEQFDDSRRAVAYWYTYGSDRNSAWFMGIGDLVENRIEFELYESTDVGFMQDASAGNESVHSIGTMTITFESCQNGTVTFATTNELVGSGSFNIERLAEIMNTHCSGGISDDMHSDAMFGEQRLELMPARDEFSGSGHASYSDFPGHMEFEIDVNGLPDGEYHLYVGMQDRGVFTVEQGHGELRFASPEEDGRMMLSFDPRGMLIEIHDAQGVLLSSFDTMFEQERHGYGGNGHDGDDDHNFDCEYGPGSGHGSGGGMGGMGHGMDNCVAEGDFIEIEVDLENSGILAEAKGEAEWAMNTHRVEFSVEIEDVPVGAYTLRVGGIKVGVINAYEMHGEVYGHIRFMDPEVNGREHLDFEPRGQKIEVLQDTTIILEVDFPTE